MEFYIYDMHAHTNCSHDSTQTIDQLCAAEIAAGCLGVAVTNHSDTPYSHENGDFSRLERSLKEADRAKREYMGKLAVMSGVEIGEPLWGKENTQRILEMGEWDVILASVHGQLENGRCKYYGGEPYDTWSREKLDTYLRKYLEDVIETAQMADYDILAHLDCPIRYISGKCHREADIMHYADLVDEVLLAVISRDKTLEVNTSGLNSGWGRTMPEIDVLSRYKELGGRRISVGSDAHISENAGKGLENTVRRLIGLGFDRQTVYHGRSPIEITF